MENKDNINPIHYVFIVLLISIIITLIIFNIPKPFHNLSEEEQLEVLEHQNWSGNLNDLINCHILFYVDINGTIKDYNFLWLNECSQIKQQCEQMPEDCYWRIEGAYTKYSNEDWNKEYQGFCDCRINRQVKNIVLDG